MSSRTMMEQRRDECKYNEFRSTFLVHKRSCIKFKIAFIDICVYSSPTILLLPIRCVNARVM